MVDIFTIIKGPALLQALLGNFLSLNLYFCPESEEDYRSENTWQRILLSCCRCAEQQQGKQKLRVQNVLWCLQSNNSPAAENTSHENNKPLGVPKLLSWSKKVNIFGEKSARF